MHVRRMNSPPNAQFKEEEKTPSEIVMTSIGRAYQGRQVIWEFMKQNIFIVF